MAENGLKKERILAIFYRFMQGENISLKKLAQEYNVSVKSISRDINEIKIFLTNNRDIVRNMEIKYSNSLKTYNLEQNYCILPKELLLIMKILIGTRAVDKIKLSELMSKLKKFTIHDDKEMIEQLIAKEMYHYQGIKHSCESLMDLI